MDNWKWCIEVILPHQAAFLKFLPLPLQVPWEDLRFLFGEIVYGGHVTDTWDRKLCRVYLEELMNPSLIEDELLLAPGFAAPPYLDYSGYHQYVDDMLPPESPALYGLHPNAEIDFLTVAASSLFRTLLEMQPRNAVSSEDRGPSTEAKVRRPSTLSSQSVLTSGTGRQEALPMPTQAPATQIKVWNSSNCLECTNSL